MVNGGCRHDRCLRRIDLVLNKKECGTEFLRQCLGPIYSTYLISINRISLSRHIFNITPFAMSLGAS